METSTIHGLWQLVDASQVSDLMGLGDSELVQWLSAQLVEHQNLTDQEAMQLQGYIGERIQLIRSLAQGGL